MFPDLPDIPEGCPVLVAGATASGKSALALHLAETRGGVIVNADALQVYEGLPILTARPGPDDLARAPHSLYGHVPPTGDYSVGDWLREVEAILARSRRPIIVGGTGLYFRALTEGLADIPAIPEEIRVAARALPHQIQLEELDSEDPHTVASIDTRNPMRVQRAWEVLRATGRGLAEWQAETPPPLLPLQDAVPILVQVPVADLNARIAARFDTMLEFGVLEEVASIRPLWPQARGLRKAIGAEELMAHLDGKITLTKARDAAITATRQFAKRQRTWFRARMGDWNEVTPER